MHWVHSIPLYLILLHAAFPAMASVMQYSRSSHHYGQKPCKNLQKRHEWRNLDNDQKADYIKAVLCLQAHPAKNPVYEEAKTRFDEFQAYHIQQTNFVHLVGQFLPWHRHFLRLYERALREECGYKGRSPYWDWTQDSESGFSIKHAPVFNPVTGFGGDGVPGTYVLPQGINASELIFPDEFRGCVQDGPFANLTLRLGPGLHRTTHCLTRGIGNADSIYLNSTATANATKSATFEVFRVQVEGKPVTSDHRMHDGGHFAVGGEMSNFYSSPGEPLFFLHHANLDRIWWNWQQMEPSRLYEISGRSSQTPPFVNVTLDWPLQMSESIGPTVPLWQVMDIHGELNCYTYV